jgi:tRNA dimethylallyltransferase
VENNQKLLLIILGPTAVGKTDLAIRVAQTFGLEIISADSRQVYKEMSIGTAAPDQAQLNAVTHHCVGHRSMHEYYNVSIYEQEVLGILERTFLKGKPALLTGGSGLYIDVVTNGIDDLPDINPELRTRLRDELEAKGIHWLQLELQQIDPVFFATVDQRNPNRMLRALEVFHSTGLKMSDLRTSQKVERPFSVIKIGLTRGRTELNARISARVDRMLELGLLDECRRLYPYRHLNALNTVGYKEIFASLSGEMSLEEAVEKIKTNTRRFAKRQMTWFRRDPEIRWFHPDQEDEMMNDLSIRMASANHE